MRSTRFMSPAHFYRWLTVVFASLMLAACGGGGGDSGNSSVSSTGSTTSSSSSSGSSSSGTTVASPTAQPIAATASNTVPITVGPGAQNFVNIPNVSVTVCVPGTSTCQTIDNIQLDTGSFGLRIAADSQAAKQILPALQLTTTASGGQLAQCTQFADGYTWGTVRNADVKIGGETASNIPIQVVGDLSASSVPSSDCINGSDESSSADLGANGILGIGTFGYDCGSSCLNAASSNYYSCPSGTNCTAVAVSLASQVTNPVIKFAVDNNGVIVQLPPLTSPSPLVTGTLVFGIGTQSNNALSGVTSFRSTDSGTVNGVYKGAATSTIFDTGSNGIFFTDSSVPACSSSFTDFYCPTSTLALTSTISGIDGTNTSTLNFSIGNAQSLGASGSNYALPGLSGAIGGLADLFDFGLPFFYGRHVYVGIESASAAPFVAF